MKSQQNRYSNQLAITCSILEFLRNNSKNKINNVAWFNSNSQCCSLWKGLKVINLCYRILSHFAKLATVFFIVCIEFTMVREIIECFLSNTFFHRDWILFKRTSWLTIIQKSLTSVYLLKMFDWGVWRCQPTMAHFMCWQSGMALALGQMVLLFPSC